MRKLQQNGSGGIEILLILVVVGILGFTGWFVYHSQSATQKTLETTKRSAVAVTKTKPTTCSVTQGIDGELYTATGGTYSICLADGWKLYLTSGASAKGSALIGGANDIVYIKDKAPIVGQTGGKDGAFSFSVFFNNPAQDYTTGQTYIGTIQAKNIAGKAYSHTQTRDDADLGLAGGVPKGTLSTTLLFTKDNKSVEIDYNQFPGDPDNSAIVKLVAESIIIN